MTAPPLRHPLRAIAAAGVGALVTVVGLQLGQLLRGRDPLSHLRTEFWHDQLGYLAIVADARNGHLVQTEPVTMTGINHYPRFYYSAVGSLARLLGLESVVAWNLVSIALQFAAAAAVGLVLASLSRTWWWALLAPLPFFTGVFAYALSGGEWYAHLQAHAVLWGPFGVLFSNNAETAGLCVGIVALCAVVWAWSAPRRRGVRAVTTLAAAGAAGGLSSFQTYSFLTIVYLLVYGAAVAGLVGLRRRRAPMLAVSAALLVVVLALGPAVADRVGQLPSLVWGLVPAVPGLVVAVMRTRGLVAAAAAVAAGTALPQVLYTLLGIVSEDPFLTYRVASNRLLGIVSWEALVGAAPVIVPLLGVLGLALARADRVATVLAGTALVVLPLLATNDLWGANAEPYRFWIEGILLGGVLAMLALARLWRRPASAPEHAGEVDTIPGDRRAGARIGLAVVTVASALVWVAALPDWAISVGDEEFQAAWSPDTPREQAITALAREATLDPDDGLLTTELCIDNRTTKATSGSPVANYHLGMAWPDERAAIDAVVEARDAGYLDFTAMADSDTRWLLTDSNCDTAWAERYADRLQLVDSVDYALSPGESILRGGGGAGSISLWSVDSDG